MSIVEQETGNGSLFYLNENRMAVTVNHLLWGTHMRKSPHLEIAPGTFLVHFIIHNQYIMGDNLDKYDYSLCNKHFESSSPAFPLFMTLSNERKNRTNCNIFCIINITCIVQQFLKMKKNKNKIWEPLEVGLPA